MKKSNEEIQPDSKANLLDSLRARKSYLVKELRELENLIATVEKGK